MVWTLELEEGASSLESVSYIGRRKGFSLIYCDRGFPKESFCQCRRCSKHRFNPWVGKTPWSRKWQPTSIFLPGKYHRQRSLVGYNPWGRRVRHD